MPYTNKEVEAIKMAWDETELMKEFMRQQHNIYYKGYNKEKRKRDIEFKVLGNLRMRLYMALKGKLKSENTINLLGCSVESLMNYIESQFDDEMSWLNYGQWHIDHIVPCHRFDLSKEEEQRKCFNYSNLRPLWASDNQRRAKK